ncbi:MAG: hypothetical protein IT204_15585 [Fimbriimonadaceae bacterium]|nr:hypothetical protein [Fimbriimonadaceae bacterium]
MRWSVLLLVSGTLVSGAEWTAAAGGWQLALPAGRVSVDRAGGLQLASPAGEPLAQTGAGGLWQLQLADRAVRAAGDQGVTVTAERRDRDLVLRYGHPTAVVTVTLTPWERGVDLRATVAPTAGTVLDVVLPGRLRFDPARVKQHIFPADGSQGVGWAFLPSYFQRQSDDDPASWQPQGSGPRGYELLFGGGLDMKPDGHPATTPVAGPAAPRWLRPATLAQLPQLKVTVNRPCTRAQVDEVVVDSPDGPWFGASRLGGRGALWRIGGGVWEPEGGPALAVVGDTIAKLAAAAPGRSIGLLNLTSGPVSGGWQLVPVADWRARLAALPGVTLVDLTSPAALLAALRSGELTAILNPYGEWLPTPTGQQVSDVVPLIGSYVRSGGNWFEVGGYSFYAALRPTPYLSMALAYPAAFADFQQLETSAGSLAVQRAQPAGAPWDRQQLFVPGRLACGGDEQSGWCERSFGTHLVAGATWTTPTARLTLGGDVLTNLRDYAAVNGFTRPLAAKVQPATLARLRSAVLLYYAGPGREKIEHLPRVPAGTLVHFADYLKGGFDKQYPDHLPPGPTFSGSAELRQLIDQIRAAGSLFMPYTNPTWWCDGPKGPTFERHGDVGLLRRLDGKLSPERYGTNSGFTTTLWHPVVQAANRLVRTQFTSDFPVDVLFQDQCGARSWVYDTNPASPTPYAYAAGMISMVDEDSALVPLSTESGWDGILNAETQFCGLSWKIVPTEGGPDWRRLLRTEVSPRHWRIYPLANALAHDKALLNYHDLGQFVTNRQLVAWTVGLGFNMNFSCGAGGLTQPRIAQWLAWLDRLQKSVLARGVGQPLLAWSHDRANDRRDRDGLIRSQHGELRVVANLDPEPLADAGQELAGYGFRATAPGLLAANLRSLGGVDGGDEGHSFVAQSNGRGATVWVRAQALQTVAVELPQAVPAPRVTLAGQPLTATATGAVLKVTLPARAEAPQAAPPAELAALPPRQWPGGAPRIGVLQIAGINPSWVTVTPTEWLTTLRAAGLPVEAITTREALLAALEAGARRWLGIVNPYGETFPSDGPAVPMLERIRQYVRGGGNWWETGGYSLHTAAGPQGDDRIGPSGAERLGLPVGGGEVQAPPEPLTVTPAGQRWLGAAAAAITQLQTPVNRGLAARGVRPEVVLLRGVRDDYAGGYRLGGWGYLWRLGGFNPQREVALQTVTATLQHLLDNPPEPLQPGGERWLWELQVAPGA